MIAHGPSRAAPPRRREKFWMVTWDESEGQPPIYNESVPQYFPTLKAARAYKAELDANPDEYGSHLVVVKESDEPWDCIAWPWLDR